MNFKTLLKPILPHVVAVVVFVLFSSLFFSPLFQGYSLKQSDVKQYQGMSKETKDHIVSNDEDPLWTNSMFGGMPTYQILVVHKKNVLTYVERALKLGLPKPVAILFTVMLGFYIFALCLRINPWLGIAVAVAYGFSTINILYLGAGHITKVNTIAYIAPTLGGLLLAFRGKPLLGASVFSLFFGLNLMANHPQMTYYLGLLCAFIGIGELVRLLLKKDARPVLYASGALLVGGALAILSNSSNLFPTNEYSDYTTRGATELTIESNGEKKEAAKKTGLDTDYILEYNYGEGELLSMLIPNARGEKGDVFGNDEGLMDYVVEQDELNATDFANDKNYLNGNRYWGGQNFSGGAFYFGVGLFILFVFGIIYVKDAIKWPILLLTLLVLSLASNDPGGLNDWFIHEFPLYNKFRDSKMILVLLQLMMPLMALLFLDGLLKKKFLFDDKKKFFISGSLVFLFFGCLYLFPSLSGNFMTGEEAKMFSESAKGQADAKEYFYDLKAQYKEARMFLFKQDALRALGISIFALGILFLYYYKKVSGLVTGSLFAVLMIGDNFSVSKRYLDQSEEDVDTVEEIYTGAVNLEYINELEDRVAYKSYEPRALYGLPPKMPGKADEYILNSEKIYISDFEVKSKGFQSKLKDHFLYPDTEMPKARKLIADYAILNQNSNFRVMNLGNPFNETQTSYYHKSIGGYHGAKLKRYQEVIEFNISKELEFIQQNLNQSGPGVFQQTPVLNMLNTKYLIFNRGQEPIQNSKVYGNAWFVSSVRTVKSADEEILALSDKTIDLRSSAIVHKEFPFVKVPAKVDEKATITMKSYAPNQIEYLSESSTDLPAVFSEIYYPKGWNCYVDGKKVKTFRANYVLRGAMIPSGKHTIKWKFEPETFARSQTASLVGSVLLLLVCFGIMGWKAKSEWDNISSNQNV